MRPCDLVSHHWQLTDEGEDADFNGDGAAQRGHKACLLLPGEGESPQAR